MPTNPRSVALAPPIRVHLMEDIHSLVLMSGGVDSSSAVAACLERGAAVAGMFFDYGQPASRSEWSAAQQVARHYGISVRRVNLGFPLISHEGEFFGRNALLILAAAGVTEARPLSIVVGIHALSEYYDTTPLFLRQMQRILHGYFGGSVTLSAPFLADTKSEVVQFAKDSGVPLELTHSCEMQDAPACGICPSCRDRIDTSAG